MPHVSQVKFADVAGCDGAKQELVSWLAMKRARVRAFDRKMAWFQSSCYGYPWSGRLFSVLP